MATSLNTLALFLIALLASGAYAIAQPSDDNGGLQMRSRAVVDTNEQLPSIDEFVETTLDAKCDWGLVAQNIVYPEQARRERIVGTVIVRALVDRTGRVRDCHIDGSDNVALNQAAIDAVTKTPFIPAVIGNKQIAVWTQVPVVFKLDPAGDE